MFSDGQIALDIQRASYSYEKIRALSDVSFQVKRGERVALLGANGSGKSTLLRLLAGLAFPERGQIYFFGRELTEQQFADEQFFLDFRRRLGIVFQNPDAQLFNARVYDEVAFGPLQLGWPKDQIRDRIEEALSRMGVAHLRDRAPHRLSGGEKKRVALASVLVSEPEVLLLDEPTAALDPSSQTQMVDLLSSWRGSVRTIVTATHDLDALETISDRCCVLHNGKVAAVADPLTILHDNQLLEQTGLLRLHPHAHHGRVPQPHTHLHTHEYL